MTQPSNPNQAPSNDVWQWAYPRTQRDKQRRLLHAGGLGALGVAGLLYVIVTAVTNDATVTSGSRTAIVFSIMAVSLAFMGDTQTRRAHSTTMAINNLGLLTITDSQSTSTLDLRTSSVPDARVRSAVRYAKISIEAASADGPWHRDLASVAGHLRLAAEDVNKLQVELHKWSIWASGGKSVDMATQTGASHPNAAVPFTWTPPRHPNAARNQKRFRIGLLVGVGGLAAGIAASQWSNGLDDVAFSMFVPVLLLLFGFGLDRSFSVGQNFNIQVANSVLTVTRGDKVLHTIPLGSIARCRVELSAGSVSSTQTRRAEWYLLVETQAEPARALIPRGFGSKFSRDDALQLEMDLNRFL